MMCSLPLPVPPPATLLPPPARPGTVNVVPAEHIAVEEPGMTATDQVRTPTLKKKKTGIRVKNTFSLTFLPTSDEQVTEEIKFSLMLKLA